MGKSARSPAPPQMKHRAFDVCVAVFPDRDRTDPNYDLLPVPASLAKILATILVVQILHICNCLNRNEL